MRIFIAVLMLISLAFFFSMFEEHALYMLGRPASWHRSVTRSFARLQCQSYYAIACLYSKLAYLVVGEQYPGLHRWPRNDACAIEPVAYNFSYLEDDFAVGYLFG